MIANEKLLKAVEQGLITDEARALINEYNDRLLSNNVPIIYNLRHLRKLLKIKKSDQPLLFGNKRKEAYKTFYIPKKSGSERKIEAPIDQLKNIQYWIKKNIIEKFNVSEYATGFKRHISIYHNALSHVGKELVINLDLKDFFPSIKYRDIFRIFNYIGYTNEVSHLLTKLCINSENVLPQGSPVSPILSNIVCLKLDKRLGKLSEKFNCSYSRYADDITFSGGNGIKNILPLVKQIIEEESFVINEKKVRLQYSFQRQEVTGLIVNHKVAAPKKIISEIEKAIYYCKKYDVVSHMQKIKCDKAFYKEHLYGIAYFIKMIDVELGKSYLCGLDQIAWIY